MTYELPENIDNNKIFIINRSDIEGRLDPLYYNSNLTKYIKNYPFVRLETVCLHFKSGFGAGKDDQVSDEDGIIQIRPTNMDKEGLLIFDKNVYVPSNSKIKFVKKGTILFNNTNSQELVGKTAILEVDGSYYTSNHITSIIVNDDIIIPKYLWLILNLYQKSKVFYSICTNWNNQSGVGLDVLKSIKIPLPDIAIQKNIVRKIELAYAKSSKKISDANNLIKSIDTYLLKELGIIMPKEDKSLKARVFTISFNDISGSRWNPSFFKNRTQKIEGGIFPNLRLGNIVDITKGQSITKNKIKDGIYPVVAGGQSSPYNHSVFNNCGNCITISASGAYAGYVWYHTDPIFASDCSVLRSIDESVISTSYLTEVLKFKQPEIYSLQQGAAQPHVYPNDIALLNIPVPPIEKQAEITNYITKIRTDANLLQQEAKDILEKAKIEVEKIILG